VVTDQQQLDCRGHFVPFGHRAHPVRDQLDSVHYPAAVSKAAYTAHTVMQHARGIMSSVNMAKHRRWLLAQGSVAEFTFLHYELQASKLWASLVRTPSAHGGVRRAAEYRRPSPISTRRSRARVRRCYGSHAAAHSWSALNAAISRGCHILCEKPFPGYRRGARDAEAASTRRHCAPRGA